MNVDGKAESVRRHRLDPAKKFTMNILSHRHHPSSSVGYTTQPVYAVKPLNDKAFTPSKPHKPFCYTWHTLRRPGAKILHKKDLAEE